MLLILGRNDQEAVLVSMNEVPGLDLAAKYLDLAAPADGVAVGVADA